MTIPSQCTHPLLPPVHSNIIAAYAANLLLSCAVNFESHDKILFHRQISCLRGAREFLLSDDFLQELDDAP